MPNNLKLAKQTKYPLRDQEKKGERIPTIIIIIYIRGRNCFLSKSIVNLNRFMFKKNHCSSRIEFLASIKILTRMYIKTLLPLRNNGGFNGTTCLLSVHSVQLVCLPITGSRIRHIQYCCIICSSDRLGFYAEFHIIFLQFRFVPKLHIIAKFILQKITQKSI